MRKCGTTNTNLHNKAYAMTNEECELVMGTWHIELYELCKEKVVTTSTTYNGDQSGLFYHKLPNPL